MKHSIITIHHIHNFGSVFQAFALQQFLKQNGYDAEIIDYRPKYYNNGRNKLKTLVGKALNIGPYCRRKKKYEQFISKNMLLSEKRFKTVEALNGWYRDKKNTYIAGGDQLWNNYHPCGNDVAYKLAFTASGRKLAYGTSLGRNDYSAEEMELIASEVEGFESIMLREQSTVPLLADKTEIQVRHVIDPVGLLDVDEFRKMAVKPKLDEPYAVMYLADSGPLLDKAIEILSKKMGLKIVHICGFRKNAIAIFLRRTQGLKSFWDTYSTLNLCSRHLFTQRCSRCFSTSLLQRFCPEPRPTQGSKICWTLLGLKAGWSTASRHWIA